LNSVHFQPKTNMKLLIINGPNLNLLGTRETTVYGDQTFEEYYKTLQNRFKNVELAYYQSNVEGELINKLHEFGFTYDGIIFNAGGYTHTSVALRDAIAAIKTPVIEVHISNVYAREDFRHTSLIAPKCKGSITGFGMDSYRLAIESFL
jgi:3-dehydroquinate dehydratase-2